MTFEMRTNPFERENKVRRLLKDIQAARKDGNWKRWDLLTTELAELDPNNPECHTTFYGKPLIGWGGDK